MHRACERNRAVDSSSPSNDSNLDDIYCTVSEVEELLCGLEVSKASGPDNNYDLRSVFEAYCM